MTIASVNPATGETLKTFPADSDRAIEEKLQKAATAWKAWRRASFAERSQRLSRAAGILEARKDALGRLMTLEMGKLRKAAVGEVEKCASAAATTRRTRSASSRPSRWRPTPAARRRASSRSGRCWR